MVCELQLEKVVIRKRRDNKTSTVLDNHHQPALTLLPSIAPVGPMTLWSALLPWRSLDFLLRSFLTRIWVPASPSFSVFMILLLPRVPLSTSLHALTSNPPSPFSLSVILQRRRELHPTGLPPRWQQQLGLSQAKVQAEPGTSAWCPTWVLEPKHLEISCHFPQAFGRELERNTVPYPCSCFRLSLSTTESWPTLLLPLSPEDNGFSLYYIWNTAAVN